MRGNQGSYGRFSARYIHATVKLGAIDNTEREFMKPGLDGPANSFNETINLFLTPRYAGFEVFRCGKTEWLASRSCRDTMQDHFALHGQLACAPLKHFRQEMQKPHFDLNVG